MKRIATLAMLSLALAACDRSDPPVKKLERAAEDAVGAVERETLPAQAQGPFAPRDECTDQPGGAEFMAQIRNAVELRDAAAFAALAAEDVRLDFGGGGGQTTLVSRLGEDDGPLWQKLDQLLTLGCSADGAAIEMPWYFAQEFPGDPMMGMVVTGENVPLRDAPAQDAATLARLSWDAVEIQPRIGEASPEGFTAVTYRASETAEPVEGYIASEDLRSWIDYRLGASRRNGRWRITHFVTGD